MCPRMWSAQDRVPFERSKPNAPPCHCGVKGVLVPTSNATKHTNASSNQHRVQRWANFIAGFSVEFVMEALEPLSPRKMVLDPFMGTGTTAIGARMLGHDVIGYEPHPLFATLAECKVRDYSPNDVAEVGEALRHAGHPLALSDSANTYLGKLFPAENLPTVLIASAQVDAIPARLQPLAVAVFLKAAEAACGSKTDGIYKAPTSTKKSVSFDSALTVALEIFRDDVATEEYRRWMASTVARIVPKTATRLVEIQDGTVGAVVTSPPYLNNFDFAEMTRMHLYLLGWATSWSDITEKVRATQITNTTTSLQGKRTSEYQDECRAAIPPELASSLAPLVSNLTEQRRVRKGKKEYDFLVYPYYRQIGEVLQELWRVMEPGAALDWVVSDAALYGQYVATHEHTATLLERIGFRDVQIKKLRERGHRWKLEKRDGAPGRLGEYHLSGVR